jgi:hypothetical protein
MSIKQIFLQQTDNFMNELCNIITTGDMLLFKEKYNFIRNANSKLIIDYFVHFVYPFKSQIISQDDKFFLEGGGQDELKDNSGLKFRDNIKNMWLSEMSDENKEIIWKYFKIFVILSEKYINEIINKDK